MLGTPLYFAPEILTRIASGGQDMTKVQAEPLAAWSIGVCVYEMLTLSPFPFKEPGHLMPDDTARMYKDMWRAFNLMVRPQNACYCEPFDAASAAGLVSPPPVSSHSVAACRVVWS